MRFILFTIFFISFFNVEAQNINPVSKEKQDLLSELLNSFSDEESLRFKYLEDYYLQNSSIPLPLSPLTIDFADSLSIISSYINENQVEYLNLIRNNHKVLHLLWCNHHVFMEEIQAFGANKGYDEKASILIYLKSHFRKRYQDSKGNKGWWALSYQIAKDQKMEISSYYDERFDLAKSTKANFTYLDHLNKTYEGKDLAIIAYIMGPEKLNKELARKNLEINDTNARNLLGDKVFEELCFSLYLGSFFNLLKPEFPYSSTSNEVEEFMIKQNLHLDQIAGALDFDLEIIKELNPTYKSGYVPLLHDSSYYVFIKNEEGEEDSVLANYNYSVLRLPIGLSERLTSRITEVYNYQKELYFPPADTNFYPLGDPKKSSYPGRKLIYYKVRRGDYLGKIARKYKVRVKDIQKWNHLRGTTIREGQRLKIYIR